MVSWVVVRHMYVIKVSCVLNTNSSRPDVVDILMTNALSFGFGVSSGLGSSCLSSNATGSEEKSKSSFKQVVRGTGWIVLISDGVFVISSIHFLIKMFKLSSLADISTLLHGSECIDLYNASSPVTALFVIMSWIFVIIATIVIAGCFIYLIGICIV
ncbi:jg6971 [Pararge aegeria aegeria]|uniref:Jg6971 protein n=1 Tax=Pararge aegeria aegeria TaxID=348720 RepID=A0A8S4SR73_9NEOP|nr:jg6971 [Pararge aegeria aegeria]